MAKLILVTCLFLLLGIGAQYFVYAVATNGNPINWSSFTISNWIFEILWIGLLVSGAKCATDED